MNLVPLGVPKQTPFWTPFISKVCIRVQVLSTFSKPSMTRTGRAFKKKELATMAHIALVASDRFEGFLV